jgi:hypothetical protein
MMGTESKDIDVDAIYDKHLAELRSSDVNVRERACVRLWGATGRQDVREALMLRSRDRNPEVRSRALMGIVGLCHEHPEIKEAVLDRLSREKDLMVFTTIVVGLSRDMLDDEELRAALNRRAKAGPRAFTQVVQERLR